MHCVFLNEQAKCSAALTRRGSVMLDGMTLLQPSGPALALPENDKVPGPNCRGRARSFLTGWRQESGAARVGFASTSARAARPSQAHAAPVRRETGRHPAASRDAAGAPARHRTGSAVRAPAPRRQAAPRRAGWGLRNSGMAVWAGLVARAQIGTTSQNPSRTGMVIGGNRDQAFRRLSFGASNRFRRQAKRPRMGRWMSTVIMNSKSASLGSS